MMRTRFTAVLVVSLALLASSTAATVVHAAEEPTWSGLEQPLAAGASWPVGLGGIGDIEFWAPNRGLLITGGRSPTIPAGLWAYNGVQWHEYSSVCGATGREADDGGRIAWASPNEFWTISDGRKGQANESIGTAFEKEPPLEDNTLCHFVGGQIVGSYAHPAFRPDSYQLMHAAACLSPSNCWFGGDPLPEPQVGSFQLHWNGSSVEEQPYSGEGHAVQDMRVLEGHIYESLLVTRFDRGQTVAPPVLRRINPEGSATLIEPEEGIFDELPGSMYESGEPANALDYLHLSAADGALWAAAGADSAELIEPPRKAGQLTLVRAVKRSWTELIGPQHPLGSIMEPKEEAEQLGGPASNAFVRAIAAEPGTNSAWLALAPPERANVSSSSQRAVLLHVSDEGAVLGEVTLPSTGEEAQGIGPKGAAAKITCPAREDCWMATTQGWLFHMAPPSQRSLPRDENESEYFQGVITYRPADQGLPQVTPDAPPEDTSGLHEETLEIGKFLETKAPDVEAKVKLPLLSKLHSRLVHGSTLELSFHLAVKARVRLLAKRRKTLVAATPMRTLGAGERHLMLRLNPLRWPTKLSLQTHALAPLPTAGSRGNNVSSISTGFFVLPRTPLLSRSDLLP